MIESLILGVHLATYHFDRSAHYCEANPGIYARAGNIAGGLYRNSECRPSAWLARQWDAGPFTLSAGAVTGYSRAPLMPLLIPSLKLGPAQLALLPPLDKKGGGLHLSFETAF